MLKFLSRPTTHKRKDHALLRSVRLQGSDPAITLIAEQRATNKYCHQFPTARESLSKRMKIRVSYEIAEDGFIAVQSVQVLRNGNQTPVCFFNRTTGQIGNITLRGAYRTILKVFIYLNDEQLAGIIEAIGRIEDSLAIKKLTRLGPEVFARRRSG